MSVAGCMYHPAELYSSRKTWHSYPDGGPNRGQWAPVNSRPWSQTQRSATAWQYTRTLRPESSNMRGWMLIATMLWLCLIFYFIFLIWKCVHHLAQFCSHAGTNGKLASGLMPASVALKSDSQRHRLINFDERIQEEALSSAALGKGAVSTWVNEPTDSISTEPRRYITSELVDFVPNKIIPTT